MTATRVPALGRAWGTVTTAERAMVPAGTVLSWPPSGRVVVKVAGPAPGEPGPGRWRDGRGDIFLDDELGEDHIIEYYP